VIRYSHDTQITVSQFRDLLIRSTLAERRPVGDEAALKGMLQHANVLVTAWDGPQLIGVARGLTDFAYCCYLSDLAVDKTYQRQGIGRELMETVRGQLQPACKIILLAAPAATEYYSKIGFTAHPSAWVK